MNFLISSYSEKASPASKSSTYGARFPDSVVQSTRLIHIICLRLTYGWPKYVVNMAHETFHNLQSARVSVFRQEGAEEERSLDRPTLPR